jgi:hypothetical protein
MVDRTNTNRYRVVALEDDGSRTAYYFSTPIYNLKTRKLVDMMFYRNSEVVYAIGSNSNLTFSNNARMENGEGYCIISLPKSATSISPNELACGEGRIKPTTNGFAYKCSCEENETHSFTIETSKRFAEIRANDKCFAVMSEKFRPFVSFSCIGTLNADGKVIAPAKISFEKLGNSKYILTFKACSPLGKSIMFEANLYEPKLFQDTTVESKNPNINNAFGSIAFIGSSNEFGEQWLYSRADVSKLSDFSDKKILKAVLHFPRLNNAYIEQSVYKLSSRFCSFGSNWNNKKADAGLVSDTIVSNNYIDLNMKNIILDSGGRIIQSEGFIIKPKIKNKGFSVIGTGDGYLFPEIFEINYK